VRDLAIIIPARDEWLAGRTVQAILERRVIDTEVYLCLDGWEPGPSDTPIPVDPRVHVLRFAMPVGQRVAVNIAARLTQARYVMKVDAHCAFAPGFDLALVEPYDAERLELTTTSVPTTVKLRAWEWVCRGCGTRTEQGPAFERCAGCKGTDHVKEMMWNPRPLEKVDFGRFDRNLQFQYWLEYRERLQPGELFPELMCLGGGCWVMPRGRFWQLGGLDEAHGGWGQMGVEIALKSWLSGGRQVVNQTTWVAHMFRTKADFSFPYPLRGSSVEVARAYSRDLWLGNRWPMAVRPVAWVPEHFVPVPEWHALPKGEA
jgi:hypothetical protein